MNDPLFGTMLAQLRPAVSTNVTAFVASVQTEITRIRVTNVSGGNRTFRMFHNIGGGAASDTAAVYYDQSVLSASVLDWGAGAPNAGLSMKAGDNIMVRSDLTSGLAFAFYGVPQARGR